MDWIKIEEPDIKPENNEWYWVTIEFLGIRSTKEAEFKRGKWYDNCHRKIDVIAWFPLKRPQPYLKEDENKETNLKEVEDKNEVVTFFSKYLVEQEEKMKKVSSPQYINWLYKYISKNQFLSDEMLLYDEENENRENSLLLSYLHSYISRLRKNTYYDEEGWEHFVFRIRDRYFDLYSIQGQGTITYVEECEKDQDAICLEAGEEPL